MDMDYMRLSKTVAYALRHDPWLYELELDEEGWTSIESLLSALREGKREWENVTEEDLHKIIKDESKKRYEIKDDKIRALYGHSLEKRIKKEPGEPPEFLFHGTSEKAYEKIKEIGLRPMSRQYVHLSIDTDMAQKVGKRKNKNPVILKVLAGKAYKDKINFYKGNEHVWLSDYVPPKYICRK